MLAIILTVAVATQEPQRPAPLPADAYADSATQQLVERARAARERNERLVTSYTATVTQRMGAGIHALSRDRMLFHQELVAHIEWHRDSPSRIEVTGAREAVPIAARDEVVPDNLADQVRWMVINPAEDYLGVFFSADSEGFVYPLKEGGERDYRFAMGGTSTIALPTGRTVRLLELVVRPRRSDWRLIEGSLWYDADSYGLVRAVFRPARPYDFHRDADAEDRKGVPRFINPGAEVKYITIEYGLYDSRWWMPRYFAADLAVTMGSMAGMPIRFERTYSDYRVQGGTPRPAGVTFRAAGTIRGDRARAARALRDSLRAREDTLRASGLAADSARADSIGRRLAADSAARRARRDRSRAAFRQCVKAATDSAEARQRREGDKGARIVHVNGGECSRTTEDSSLVVVVPTDSAALLANPQLGRPILDMGDVISENELRQIGDAIHVLPQRPWDYRPDLPRGVSALVNNLRYNRIEALSIGIAGKIDFGRLNADALVRMGTADRRLNFEAGLTRPTSGGSIRLGAYQRLAAANPEVQPFSVGSSLASLTLQRDDGEYFRTRGAELKIGTGPSGWWDLRLYGERQRTASVSTEFSLPHVFNSAHLFRPNFTTQDADQYGASLGLRRSRVLSRVLLLGGEMHLGGESGDYRFGRGSLTLNTTITPSGPLALGLEAAAGTSTGTVPVQSFFYLGGPETLRGYDGAAIAGPAFWRGRAELGTSLPVARLILFGDIGWAGPRAQFRTGRSLIGAGVGASFLDGLIRMDLGRALRGPVGYRFDVYLDGRL